MFYYVENILDQLNKAANVIIYGAGNIGVTVAECLQSEYYNIKIKFFAVSQKNMKSMCCNDIPVYSINDLTEYRDKSLIVISVMDKYYKEIYDNLMDLGFKNILSMTFESRNWELVRINYLMHLFKSNNEKYIFLNAEIKQEKNKIKYSNKKIFKIFMAKSHVDKKILSTNINSYTYLIPLQVGAQCTEKQIAFFRDDVGDNISSKNVRYCELTGFYWIWKNVFADYVGICHYRRYFDIKEAELQCIYNLNIDVVLAIPILNFPNVKAVYERDHISNDWIILMNILKETNKEYYDTAIIVFNDIYYYPYNMLIAKKEIFDECAAWLFPILSRIEIECENKLDKYQKRDMGFLGERLVSLFFLHNRKKYKIAHASKVFYT